VLNVGFAVCSLTTSRAAILGFVAPVAMSARTSCSPRGGASGTGTDRAVGRQDYPREFDGPARADGVLLEREFLKKTATFFASEHNAPTPARREEHGTTHWNSVLWWSWLRQTPYVPVSVADLRFSRCHIHEVATGRQG
jgi:hypothetical protein